MDYLGDGITESLILGLSRLPQLKVTAQSSVFRYKGQTDRALEIGHALGVEAVLTGRVLQRGNALQISVDRNGKLAVVNLIPLEELLKGLVPSEIFARSHPEALKAQAIAARSVAYYAVETAGSVEEARRALWVTSDDPTLANRIRRLWKFSARLVDPRIPRGLRRFHTIEEANQERERWVRDRTRALLEARRAPRVAPRPDPGRDG